MFSEVSKNGQVGDHLQESSIKVHLKYHLAFFILEAAFIITVSKWEEFLLNFSNLFIMKLFFCFIKTVESL